MLQADKIAQLLQRQAGAPEVLKFFRAVHRSGIEDNVVMDMSPVCVRCHDKGVFALGKPQRQLIPHPVCFFRRDLTGLERLPDLVGDHVAVLLLSGRLIILPLLQHKFFIDRIGIAAKGCDCFALFCFLRILCIICPLSEALCHGTAFMLMQGNKPRCCHADASLQKMPGTAPDHSDAAPVLRFY